MSSIQEILSFSQFLLKFREVERSIFFSHDPSRRENDAEHCWQLAMVSRYVISTKNLPLSLERVLQYCMVHDIPETYAWDIEALSRTPEQQKAKEERETEAFSRIKTEFPEWHVLREWLEKYEHRADDEAKFVYALDKILPVMNLYNDNWYRRKQRNVTLEMELRPAKENKVQVSPPVAAMRDELYELLKLHEKEIFYNPDQN